VDNSSIQARQALVQLVSGQDSPAENMHLLYVSMNLWEMCIESKKNQSSLPVGLALSAVLSSGN
jgi:hypothetical protein